MFAFDEKLLLGAFPFFAEKDDSIDGDTVARDSLPDDVPATNWTDLAALLRTRAPGAAVDLPGFGRSRPLASRDYSPAAHADALRSAPRTCASKSTASGSTDAPATCQVSASASRNDSSGWCRCLTEFPIAAACRCASQ